ncbi:MAG: TerC family protein [Isosphaeraceae bacterium]
MAGIDLAAVWLYVMAILWLVFLEGLLSADNALVLAMMVRHLPKAEQKRALRYGIWGAFVFRVIAVLLAKVLLEFWPLKVVGGLYLLYLAVNHFFLSSSEDDGEPRRRFGSGFWGTVVSVELADIAFSIDSILAAVAAADSLPDTRVGANGKFGVVIVGGILGILTMRFVAGYFIILLERFRGLETGAYGLVAWIGLKLVVSGVHDGHYIDVHMNEWVFWVGMAAIVAMGFLYQPRKPGNVQSTAELARSFNAVMEGEDESLPPVEVGSAPAGTNHTGEHTPESTETSHHQGTP